MKGPAEKKRSETKEPYGCRAERYGGGKSHCSGGRRGAPLRKVGIEHRETGGGGGKRRSQEIENEKSRRSINRNVENFSSGLSENVSLCNKKEEDRRERGGIATRREKKKGGSLEEYVSNRGKDRCPTLRTANKRKHRSL